MIPTALALSTLAFSSHPAPAAGGGETYVPPGFVAELFAGPLEQLTGLTFSEDGRLFVWQKKGLVWTVNEDGTINPAPVLDITEEVGNWGDNGLHGVALDPDFATNGFVYLYYVVDHYYLENFGTPGYDPALSTDFYDTIARVTRYTVTDPNAASPVVDPASRLILVGEDKSSGIPICTKNHTIGWLAFGSDRSLLISMGDSALGDTSVTCLSDGIIEPKEDVGPWRSQLVDGHNGKILRISPTTGNGLPSNPFFDMSEPRAARSRVWALGLRNPFRFTVQPGTGSTDHTDGDPGILLVGDVGNNKYEELCVIRSGGENFGWPIREGFAVGFKALQDIENLDAPNPLFGIDGCSQEHFFFRDLFVEDSLNPPFWPNPCSPGIEIPASVPRFMHSRPELVWRHTTLGDPEAYVPIYDGAGEADFALLGSPESPVPGNPFAGNCSIGGVWYTGDVFPPEYQNTYFHFDFSQDWVKAITIDPLGNVVAVEDFGEDLDDIIATAVNPLDGAIYYIKYYGSSGSTIRRLKYTGVPVPTASVTAQPKMGAAPLRVQFDAASSADPLQEGLSYTWDFGDGVPTSPIHQRPDPVHVFPAADVTDAGTFVSSLDELVPPTPMGAGAPTPDVARDLAYPQTGDGDPLTQFDTTHLDSVTLLPDKGGLDWIGYTFAAEQNVFGLYYQEGLNTTEGGWFESFGVQLRDPISGAWEDVHAIETIPAYPGSPSLSYETFQVLFEPKSATGVRLYGVPGGTQEYVSVGELRVLAAPASAGPTLHQVQVTVVDGGGESDVEATVISTDNTPPVVTITSPPQGMTYPSAALMPLDLQATVSDAEHSAGELTCVWTVSQMHNDHSHDEPSIQACSGSSFITPHGEPALDILWYRVRLDVTDAAGLTTSVLHTLVPDDDCNLNGQVDGIDIALGVSADENFDGIPDECQVDCDNDGLQDAAQIAGGVGIDENFSGVLDACEPALIGPDPGVPGVLNLLKIEDAQPNALLFFLSGFNLGSFPVPPCQGLSIFISDWILLGSLFADELGQAELLLFVQPGAPGLQVHLQAVDPFGCEVTNLSVLEY
ncbi:MAG: PQQ-dependent sugar dehydrogenase [Planctomycetota bacterium]